MPPFAPPGLFTSLRVARQQLITTENRDVETARQVTTTVQKEDKGTMPAVSWIDMQPESSVRTSLKSFTDYLTESQDDAAVFTPSNRLCLSPETLKALDSAEKLVDDVERQLSQMHFDESLTDDTDEDRLNAVGFNDERLYVQNLVKTVFEKGYYEPVPRPPVFNRDNAATSYKRVKSSKLKSSKVLSKPIDAALQRIESSPPVIDECLLCKSNGIAASAKQAQHKAKEASAHRHVEETKINEDKPEKLNVQKAPSISIKGPLAVQTARIVDIQPAQRIAPRQANIVTHECRHLDEPPKRRNVEASIIHANQLEQDMPRIRREQRKLINKSTATMLNYSTESGANDSIDDKENKSWPECEDVELDLDDFSLREPKILVEVDAVLEQQRNIIRRVNEATHKFDQFLAERLSVESSDASLEEVEDIFEGRLPEKQKYSRKSKDSKKVSSGVDAELGRNKAIDTERDKSPSISRESLKPTKSASVSRRIINDDRPAKSNTRSSSSTVPSEASNKIFEDSDKQKLAEPKKLSTEESKDAQYSESFESESSADQSEPDKSKSLQSESGVQLKNIDKKVSSNNISLVQSSVHTETKSNAGFIENLKSSPNLKENNLVIGNRQNATVSRNDVSLPIGNDNVDKESNRNEKSNDQRQVDERKQNGLHISETDDERELNNYEFDDDLLEEINKHIEKVDEDVEFKKDKSIEKLQGDLEENSQKTSHLIDSISDISYHGSSQPAKNPQDSQKISSASNHESIKSIENSVREAVKELSTESKIEIKLTEARDNLKVLMKSINFSLDSEEENKPDDVPIVNQERNQINEINNKKSADDEVSELMKNITLRVNDARRQNCRMMSSPNVSNHVSNNLPNDRSCIATLQENRDAVQDSLERQKLLLLKNLESCTIQSPIRGKRLFTSTVVDDADPPVNFTRSKESSTIRQDSLSDSNSEGEIHFSSTASHSLGEIRRKILDTKSSCSTKESTSTSSANLNNSSSRSAGEINGTKAN